MRLKEMLTVVGLGAVIGVTMAICSAVIQKYPLVVGAFEPPVIHTATAVPKTFYDPIETTTIACNWTHPERNCGNFLSLLGQSGWEVKATSSTNLASMVVILQRKKVR